MFDLMTSKAWRSSCFVSGNPRTIDPAFSLFYQQLMAIPSGLADAEDNELNLDVLPSDS